MEKSHLRNAFTHANRRTEMPDLFQYHYTDFKKEKSSFCGIFANTAFRLLFTDRFPPCKQRRMRLSTKESSEILPSKDLTRFGISDPDRFFGGSIGSFRHTYVLARLQCSFFQWAGLMPNCRLNILENKNTSAYPHRSALSPTESPSERQ